MFAISVRNGRGTAVRFALCLLLLLTLSAPANISIPELPKKKRVDKKTLVIPPPQPVAVAAEVSCGGTVQIPLRIYGKLEQTISFLVRKEPELGKIVSIAPLESEVWLLTYQHTAAMTGEARMQDHILFAAQNKDGVSAPAEIAINIVDIPPELAAPEPVEYGKIAAGLPATRTVVISNKGGGLLEGRAVVDEPWTIDLAHFRLRHGERATFHLTLVPDAEREYQGRLHLVVGDTQTQPTLHATAFAPFTVEPAQLELTPGPERSGTVTLTNRTPEALTVQLEANPRLHLPAQVLLPPRRATHLPVTLESAESHEGLDATIRFTLGAISKPVQVHAPAAPVITQATPEPAPQPAPEPAPQPEMRPPPPPPTDSAPLPPPHPGPKPQADRHEAPPPPPPPPGDVPGHNPPSPESLDFAGFDAAIMKAEGDPKLPFIRKVSVVSATVQGTAEITWSAPKAAPEISSYRVEVRHLSIGPDGFPLQKWIAVPDVQFTRKSDQITAFLTDIPPGTVATFHILALGPQGEPCAVSLPARLNVPAPQPIFTPRNFLLAGFGLLLALSLGIQWAKSRRPTRRR